jgi:hypothetical protein
MMTTGGGGGSGGGGAVSCLAGLERKEGHRKKSRGTRGLSLMCAQRLTCSVLTVCLERSRMNTVKRGKRRQRAHNPAHGLLFYLTRGRANLEEGIRGCNSKVAADSLLTSLLVF